MVDIHGGTKMEYVKLEMKTGEIIYLEIFPSQQESGRERQVASRSKNKTIPTYQAESFFKTVTGFAHGISEKLRECKASEIEIEFGLSFNVDTGEILSVIVNSSTGASMKVKLTWKEDSKSNDTGAISKL